MDIDDANNKTGTATKGDKRMTTDTVIDEEKNIKKLKSKEKKIKNVSKRTKIDISPQQGMFYSISNCLI